MNIDTYYEQQGSGSPIVFIHGSYATTSTWKRMIDELASKHHCISIKLPGHCGTPDPDDFENPSIDTELDLIEQIVSKLTDQPIHLVAHSFGGVIALAQALKGNLNLSQVSLFEPVAIWILDQAHDEEMCMEVQRFLTKYRHDVSLNTPYACGQVIDFWGGQGSFDTLPDFIKDSMEPLVKNNIRHWDLNAAIDNKLLDLQQCAVPMRLIHGDKSNPVAHAICNHMNTHLPKSKKYIIKGASHFLVTSHANECLETLNDKTVLL
jgi:pimeloyl-ACP methyl ester carboxylesterase